MIRLFNTSIFLIIFILLGGCSYFNRSSSSIHNTKPIHIKEYQPNCNNDEIQSQTCPSIKFDSIEFKKPKQINALINKQLLQMLNAADDKSLEDYLRDSLARANTGYYLDISVKLLSENDVLIVLELTVQESNTIDQYSPKKITFINFDKNKKQNISLKQAILPDKTEAFWSTVQLAYLQWLEFQQLLNNKSFQENWPFVKTQNIALVPKQVILKYDGNTLAPYAMGEPTLFIPYGELKDILKPEYLPH